jgi:hypothetical protein
VSDLPADRPDPTRDAAYYKDLAFRHAKLPAYRWAAETLYDIGWTIERTGRVTVKQREAIEHIILGRIRHDGRGV